MMMLTLLFLFSPSEIGCPPEEHILEPSAFIGCRFALEKTGEVGLASHFAQLVVNLLRQRQMTTGDVCKCVYNENIPPQTHLTHPSAEEVF
jgi:hypothetical protein